MKTRIKSPLFKNLQNIFDFEHVKFTVFVITCRKEPPCIKTNLFRDLNKLCENSFLFRIQLTEFSPCLACKFYFFTADVY